jgi:Uncharacterized protein conserved in bacteria
VNPGSTQHLTAELFKSTAGVNFVIVPFRTTPEAVIALMRNDVQMVIDFYAGLNAGLSDGKLRPVAWSAAKRSPALPGCSDGRGGWCGGLQRELLECALCAVRRAGRGD